MMYMCRYSLSNAGYYKSRVLLKNSILSHLAPHQTTSKFETSQKFVYLPSLPLEHVWQVGLFL